MTAARAGRTRDAIVDAALELFRENGFERTTMRAIADRAGVSVGNAYYYFSSKDELVQGFYDQLVADHRALALPAIAGSTAFADRLARTEHAWITAAEPYRDFAGRFFAVAAQPGNPLSPFSDHSSPAREAAVTLYREVLTHSSARPERAVAEALPELLWLYHLGIVLYWVHDSSPGCRKTYLLVERTVPLVKRMVSMSRLPGFRSVTRDLVGVIRDVRA